MIWSASSHRFPANGTPEATVFHTRFKGKLVRVACAVGKGGGRGKLEVGGNAFLALTTLERAALNATHIELSSGWEVPVRMRDAFTAAERKDALFFICRDDVIYALACTMLNAQFSLEDLRRIVWQEPPMLAPWRPESLGATSDDRRNETMKPSQKRGTQLVGSSRSK